MTSPKASIIRRIHQEEMPSNQGTAPAIVYSLAHLGKLDPEGIVAFFPSDHYFFDDASFIRDLDSAYTAAAFLPEMVVLLGIPPEAPEVEYGWIEPGIPDSTRAASRCRSARRGDAADASRTSRTMAWRNP